MSRTLCLLALLAALGAAASSQTFSSPHTYSLPQNPPNLVVADINHDGFADVLSADTGANSIMIKLNNGDGTFRTIASPKAGPSPLALAVADLNGDGKVDIAVANQSTTAPTVSVLLGNGDGTFQLPKSYAVAGTPTSITIDDFNNDGRPDIATISDKTTKVSILTRTSTSFQLSSFTVPQAFPSQYGGGFNDYLFSLTSGDFNGDHRIDLAYVDQCGTADCIVVADSYYVLINNGGGSWTPHSVGGGSGTRTLRAADLDNDGRSDLVNTYYGCYHEPCTGIDVFFSNGTTFQRVAVVSGFGYGGDPADAVVGDFNNDGRMDIAAPVESGMDEAGTEINTGFAVYTGKAGRAFNPPRYYSDSTGLFPTLIVAGFLNADGKKDIVTADSSVNAIRVFKNTTVSTNDPCTYPGTAGLHFCKPASSSSVAASGTQFVAAAHALSQPVRRMELWVDGHKRFQTSNDRLSRTLTLTVGSHYATVVEVDAAGHIVKSTHTFTAH
jgi:hypothetical protein